MRRQARVLRARVVAGGIPGVLWAGTAAQDERRLGDGPRLAQSVEHVTLSLGVVSRALRWVQRLLKKRKNKPQHNYKEGKRKKRCLREVGLGGLLGGWGHGLVGALGAMGTG